MQISFSLQGKVALVTGGNGGIGRSIALGYKAMGATVIATGRNPDKNAAVAQELGHGHEVISLDVRDEGAVDQAVAAIAERHGRFDILVNNAGIARRTDILDMETADWHAVIDTHLNGGFYCAKGASKAMVNAGNGGNGEGSDRADLIVANLRGPVSLTLERGTSSVSATYEVTVSNRGAAASGGFRVRLGGIPDSDPLVEVVGGLGPGESISFSHEVAFSADESVVLVATVDSNDEVSEGDEGNNSTRLEVTVSRN